MDPLLAAVLGVVEGLTEFLPVSSTGHLVLASTLLGLPQTTFVKSFEIAIQSGAMLAVLVLFWRRFLDRRVLPRILAAFVPTAVAGVLLYAALQALLSNQAVILASLAVGGAVMIALELRPHHGADVPLAAIPYRHCVVVGLCQAVAIIPGVSRSAATILGGLGLGIPRRTITLFSFLLAVPTLVAAAGFDLLQASVPFTPTEAGALLTGFAASFLVGLVALKWLLGYVQSHTFLPFGVYRIVLAALFWLLVVR